MKSFGNNLINKLEMMGYCPVAYDIKTYAYCGNGCFYCFANLNHVATQLKYHNSKMGQSEPPINQIRQIYNPNPSNYIGYLLANNYVGILSNSTDSFQDIEQKTGYTKEVLRAYKETQRPFIIQTKANLLCHDERYLNLACDCNSVFFITITSDSDEIGKEIEKNAPKMSDRIELIKELKRRGKYVRVGVLPYHPQFIKNHDAFFTELTSIADVVTVEHLHFSCGQNKVCHKINPELWEKYRQIPVKEFANMAQNLTKYGDKVEFKPEIQLFLDREKHLYCCGLDTSLFKGESRLLPNIREFISSLNYLYYEEKMPIEAVFDDFIESLGDEKILNIKFPKGQILPINCRFETRKVKYSQIPAMISIADVFRILWENNDDFFWNFPFIENINNAMVFERR